MSTENAVDQPKPKRRRGRWREQAGEAETSIEGTTESKGKATVSKRDQEKRKGNFITRPIYGFIEYLQDVRSEIRKVTWPTREETIHMTRLVIIVTIISAIVLGILTIILDQVIALGLEIPAILIGIIVGAVLVALYLIRRSNRSTSSY